jgi:hypothetical protein
VRRLPDRLDNSDIWIEYDGFSKHKKLLDSNANFEEFEVTSTDKKLHIKAQTLRLYNPTSHQWSTIWSMWITGLSACLPSLASLQGIAASFSTRRLQRPSHSRALRLAQPLTQRRAHGAVVLT